MQNTGCVEKKWSKICILHPNAHPLATSILHFTSTHPRIRTSYRKHCCVPEGYRLVAWILVLVNNYFMHSRHFITGFGGHLPHYLWRMVSIVSQIVVVLVKSQQALLPLHAVMR